MIRGNCRYLEVVGERERAPLHLALHEALRTELNAEVLAQAGDAQKLERLARGGGLGVLDLAVAVRSLLVVVRALRAIVAARRLVPQATRHHLLAQDGEVGFVRRQRQHDQVCGGRRRYNLTRTGGGGGGGSIIPASSPHRMWCVLGL